MHTPITEKQIMQLKPGDPLIIHGTFEKIYTDGDIVVKVKETNICTNEYQDHLIWVSPTCVSLPSEPPTSFGPYRRFRKGDRVRVVAWQGRSPGCSALLGKITTVLRDEYEFGVRIQIGEGESYCTPEACFLELITPVEELEPYEVTESTDYFAVENSAASDEVATFWKDLHPSPKEAAEAERDRLNADHRKEMAQCKQHLQ